MVTVSASVFPAHAICTERGAEKIDVGVGYAVWSGIGAVGAALLGSVFLGESLTLVKGFWLVVIIAGVVWLKLAD